MLPLLVSAGELIHYLHLYYFVHFTSFGKSECLILHTLCSLGQLQRQDSRWHNSFTLSP